MANGMRNMHILYLTAPIEEPHKRCLPPSMSHSAKNLFQITLQIQRHRPLSFASIGPFSCTTSFKPGSHDPSEVYSPSRLGLIRKTEPLTGSS